MRSTPTTQEKGAQAMTSVAMDTERDQVIRWMQDGRHILDTIMKLLSDYDQLKATAEATQLENEQLREEGERLRAELSQLRDDNERGQKERAEMAEWFSNVMSEAAARLAVRLPAA
jgi:predicted nuclease with TOPRIM domain